MALLGKQVEELIYLNMQKKRQNEEIDGELLELCSQLLEAKRSENGEIVFQTLPQVEQYLKHMGVEIIDYNPKAGQYFKVLPAKKGERTISPALVKDGKLLRPGIAAVCNDQ